MCPIQGLLQLHRSIKLEIREKPCNSSQWMRLHQGVYLNFCNSLEIYYFTLDLFPIVHGMDGISSFLCCPTCVVTGPSCNHWAGTWHHEPTPCRRVQIDVGCDHPTHIYPVVLQELGIRQVSILWPPSSGCLLTLNGRPRLRLIGEKKSKDWVKRDAFRGFQLVVGCWVLPMLG